MSKEDKAIFWRLLSGVYGGWGEWRDACRFAILNGWTERQVARMLWFHPASIMWGGAAILAIFLTVKALL